MEKDFLSVLQQINLNLARIADSLESAVESNVSYGEYEEEKDGDVPTLDPDDLEKL